MAWLCKKFAFVVLLLLFLLNPKFNKTALKLISSPNNSGYYENQRTAANGKSMNQWGGSGAGKQLGEWNAGDVNNPLSFVTEMPAPVPDFFSYEDAPEYYCIQFANGENMRVTQKSFYKEYNPR